MNLRSWVAMWAVDDSPGSQATTTYTMSGFTPGTNVFTEISLTNAAPGVSAQAGTVGAVGVLIPRWQSFNPDESVSSFQDLSRYNTVLDISSVATITFELDANYAEGYAHAVVYTL
jgi:hypothetical protein